MTSSYVATLVPGSRATQVLNLLAHAGPRGLTWREVAQRYQDAGGGSLHHGQVSSVLSHLHHTSRALRLEESREGSGVYVLPVHRRARQVIAPRTLKRATAPSDFEGQQLLNDIAAYLVSLSTFTIGMMEDDEALNRHELLKRFKALGG